MPTLQTRRLRPGSQDLTCLVPQARPIWGSQTQSCTGRAAGGQPGSVPPPTSFSSASPPPAVLPCPLRLGWGRSQGARRKCGSGLNVGTGPGEPHRSPTPPPHHALAAADTHRLSTRPRHAGDAFRTRPALGDTEGPQSGLGDCSPRCVTGSWEGDRSLAHHLLDSGLAGGQLWGPGPTPREKGLSSRSYLRVLGVPFKPGEDEMGLETVTSVRFGRCLIISGSLNPRVVFSVAPS